jgi:hypothetical protein
MGKLNKLGEQPTQMSLQPPRFLHEVNGKNLMLHSEKPVPYLQPFLRTYIMFYYSICRENIFS